jgi:hypothetical protein
MQATADLISDEYKVYYGKRQRTVLWILSDDRIIKNWDGTCIAGIDKANPRVEVTITPLPTNFNEETDPALIKILKERQEIKLF